MGIPTTLFGGPPELGDVVKLGQSQLSFMDFFARPMFEAVTDVLPAMVFALDKMKVNQATWTERIRRETCGTPPIPRGRDASVDRSSSRSMRPRRSASQSQMSHPEGLPASGRCPQALVAMTESQPTLPSQTGRSLEGFIHYPLSPLDSNTLTDDAYRSSYDKYFDQGRPTSGQITELSSRSPGTLSGASNPNGIVVQRRTSNTPLSKVQLGPESRTDTYSSIATSENRHVNKRPSADTLSQINYINGATPLSSNRRISASSGGAGDTAGQSSKGHEQVLSNSQSVPDMTPTRSYGQSGRHRSSSGAHTNNTIPSQSAPHSPTDTHATSVLTVDSDENSYPSGMDNWMERNDLPNLPDVERPGSNHRFGNLRRVGGNIPEIDTKAVLGKGSLRDSLAPVQRSIGKKNSKFNIFHAWKRKGNKIEACSYN